MNKKEVLVQVNNFFEFNWCNAIVLQSNNSLIFDIIVPSNWRDNRALSDFEYLYRNIYFFNLDIRNLFSLKKTYNLYLLISWLKKSKSKYDYVLFGAYRNDMTNVISKYFKGRSRLIAIKQGLDLPKSEYRKVSNLIQLHNKVFCYFFGYSYLYFSTINQKVISYESSKFMYDRLFWKNDPIYLVYTIGSNNSPIYSYKDQLNKFLLPNLISLYENKFNIKNPREGILIVGERTPMTPLWSKANTQEFIDYLSIIKRKFSDHKLFLRERKNLTNKSFYEFLNPIYLDPNEDFENQLINLNPLFVFSVKSSACKTASYLGFQSAVLYNLFSLNQIELNILNHFFADCHEIFKPSSLEDLQKLSFGNKRGIIRDNKIEDIFC
jgi:hypothetical protein